MLRLAPTRYVNLSIVFFFIVSFMLLDIFFHAASSKRLFLLSCWIFASPENRSQLCWCFHSSFFYPFDSMLRTSLHGTRLSTWYRIGLNFVNRSGTSWYSPVASLRKRLWVVGETDTNRDPWVGEKREHRRSIKQHNKNQHKERSTSR